MKPAIWNRTFSCDLINEIKQTHMLRVRSKAELAARLRCRH